MLAFVCLILFFGLTAAVLAGVADTWDRTLMLDLAAGREPWLTWGMKLLSVAGSGLIEIPLALLLILGLVLRKRKAEAWWYAAAALSGWALSGLAKLAVQRPRPHVIPRLMHGAGWFSYPSGHSMLAPIIFGLGIIVWAAPWPSPALRRAALVLAALFALGIGFSRVYLGVHYPSDVVGGLLLGIAWSALALLWWERIREATR
ncbi:MAG TPA: phosphatase PAP2 family protein [Gemmatimonadales bacterium]|nr:phosphatase PAP2 family protein [Gemmatimonadales bacterium]